MNTFAAKLCDLTLLFLHKASNVRSMIDWIQSLLVNDNENAFNEHARRTLGRLLKECKSIYREATAQCLQEFPHRIEQTPSEFQEKMIDLQHGALLKTLVTIAWSDRRWTDGEKATAKMILKSIWDVDLDSATLQKSLQQIVAQANQLKWTELLRPFTDIPELRPHLAQLVNNLIKIANLLTKVDDISSEEMLQLEELRRELSGIYRDSNSSRNRKTNEELQPSKTLHLDDQMIDLIHSSTACAKSTGNQSPGNSGKPRPPNNYSAPITNSTISAKVANSPGPGTKASLPQVEPIDEAARKVKLDEGMKELDSLIGLTTVKQDIRQLINYLQMQSAREKMNLPMTKVSLHTLFTGNPGTGKTTVARILGKLFCGLGILQQGHTVEVDRSALVAEYAGQTAPKTHACIDKALDGVLFVDEAYSLVSSKAEDAYGREALQVLLKRMEDDRDRLVVVLAGYSEPMEDLLRTNPGLTSRFQRKFNFPDYEVPELIKIFNSLCRKYHYKMTKEASEKLKFGLVKLVKDKDEHFGNGRTVRNLFEAALQKMATRIVASSKMTESVLSLLHADDMDFKA